MPRPRALLVLALALPAQTTVADDNDSIHAEPTARYTQHCATERRVVGRRHCPYGVWGDALEEPYLFMSIGLNVRRLPRTRAPAAVPRAIVDEPAAPIASDTSTTLAQRFGIAPNGVLYAGLEAEMAPASAEPVEGGARKLDAGLQALVGLHGGSTVVRFGAELGAGGRLVRTAEATTGRGEWAFEARARLDVWLSPWVTIGAAVGSSMLERGDWMTGVHLGVHSYAYGGR